MDIIDFLTVDFYANHPLVADSPSHLKGTLSGTSHGLVFGKSDPKKNTKSISNSNYLAANK
jgi:hypothetical protein